MNGVCHPAHQDPWNARNARVRTFTERRKREAQEKEEDLVAVLSAGGKDHETMYSHGNKRRNGGEGV
jgi:dihydroxyacetone kinase